ncbi:MAG: amidohydrolase family protein [Candidatus Limnocylindria bacterium]
MRLLLPDLLLDATRPQPGQALAIDGGLIVGRGALRALTAAHPDAPVERLDGCALMPGTVNAHSHSFQSALRGVSADRPFDEWREALYRTTPSLTVEDIHVTALHAFAEMLLSGITTVVDFFYLHHGSNDGSLAVVEAARKLGLRLVLARCLYDGPQAPAAFRETVEEAIRNCQQLAAQLQGNDLATVIPAPHSPHAASPELIAAGARLARDWGTPWHLHAAESAAETAFTRSRYGRTPLGWLDQAALLDERLWVVHGVHVSPDEISRFAAAGAGLIHCPSANLALGDGLCPISAYATAGVPIALGCDSASSAGRLSVFSEMRLAALLQKGLARSADAIDAGTVLAMGTAGGALAAGLPVGSLAPGSRSDLVALDLGDLSLLPAADLRSNVVYAMRSEAIRHVLVNGDFVVRDRALVKVTLETIRAGIETVADRHRAR